MGFEEGTDAFIVEGVTAGGDEEGLTDRDCEEACGGLAWEWAG